MKQIIDLEISSQKNNMHKHKIIIASYIVLRTTVAVLLS